MSPSATPATQNGGRCHQVLRLPHETPRRHSGLSGPKQSHQSQPSAISATPATQSDGRCHQVPRQRDPSASPEPAQCHKCHA
eukprot:s3998_g3.t1